MPGYEEQNTHYRHIRLNEQEENNIWRIMGKEGKVFKAITNRSRCKYIWYNKEKGVIEIWGPYDTLMTADELVKERINKCVNNEEKKEIENNNEHSM